MNKYLLTKDQTANALKSFGISEPLPKTGKKLVLCFPGQVLNHGEVIKTKFKSTYGKILYQLTLTTVKG